MTPTFTRFVIYREPALLVPSDNYRRRISVMYRRDLVEVDGVLVTPELFIYTKNDVQANVGGRGIFVLPAMQFQVELDKKDCLWAVADVNAALLAATGIEVSVIIEALQDDRPVETTEPGGEGKMPTLAEEGKKKGKK